MPDYQKMYFQMFHSITDALEELSDAHYETASLLLKRAQIVGEESYSKEEHEQNTKA